MLAAVSRYRNLITPDAATARTRQGDGYLPPHGGNSRLFVCSRLGLCRRQRSANSGRGDRLRARLKSYMVPKYVEFVGESPKTNSQGKDIKSWLPESCGA